MLLRLKGLLPLLVACLVALTCAVGALAEESEEIESFAVEELPAQDIGEDVHEDSADNQRSDSDSGADAFDEVCALDSDPDDVEWRDESEEMSTQMPALRQGVVIFLSEGLADGSGCRHAGSTRESIIPMGSHYEWNSTAHTRVIEKRIDTICDECGAIIRSELMEIPDRPESHTFLGGQCQFCHYVCLHTYDECGICTLCGYQCSHSVCVDGRCAACGKPVLIGKTEDAE